jgi:hypothetical protein
MARSSLSRTITFMMICGLLLYMVMMMMLHKSTHRVVHPRKTAYSIQTEDTNYQSVLHEEMAIARSSLRIVGNIVEYHRQTFEGPQTSSKEPLELRSESWELALQLAELRGGKLMDGFSMLSTRLGMQSSYTSTFGSGIFQTMRGELSIISHLQARTDQLVLQLVHMFQSSYSSLVPGASGQRDDYEDETQRGSPGEELLLQNGYGNAVRVNCSAKGQSLWSDLQHRSPQALASVRHYRELHRTLMPIAPLLGSKAREAFQCAQVRYLQLLCSTEALTIGLPFIFSHNMGLQIGEGCIPGVVGDSFAVEKGLGHFDTIAEDCSAEGRELLANAKLSGNEWIAMSGRVDDPPATASSTAMASVMYGIYASAPSEATEDSVGERGAEAALAKKAAHRRSHNLRQGGGEEGSSSAHPHGTGEASAEVGESGQELELEEAIYSASWASCKAIECSTDTQRCGTQKDGTAEVKGAPEHGGGGGGGGGAEAPCCAEVLGGMIAEAAHVMDMFNISHVLFYGSLLGQTREGGLIPWSSDVDLLVPAGSLGKEAWEERELEERRRSEEEGFAEGGSGHDGNLGAMEGGDKHTLTGAKKAEARARVRARAEAMDVEAKEAAADEALADQAEINLSNGGDNGARWGSGQWSRTSGGRRARRSMRIYTMTSPEVVAALRDRGLNYWREGDSTQMGRICPWRGISQTRNAFTSFKEVNRQDPLMAEKAGRYPDHFPYIDLYAAGIGSTDNGRTLQVLPREWSACSWVDNEYCYTSVPIESVFPLKRCRIATTAPSSSYSSSLSSSEGGASFVELNCPRVPGDVLAILYGKSWKTPSRGVIGTDHQANISKDVPTDSDSAASSDGAGGGGKTGGGLAEDKSSVVTGSGGSRMSGGEASTWGGWVSGLWGGHDGTQDQEHGQQAHHVQRQHQRRRRQKKGVGGYDMLMLSAYVAAIVVVIYCAVPEACGAKNTTQSDRRQQRGGGYGDGGEEQEGDRPKRRGARGISSLSRGSVSSHGPRLLSLSGSLSGSMQGSYFGPPRGQGGYFW